MLSMNCRGGAKKVGDILALLLDLNVDVAFLQELWEGFDQVELGLTPYRLFYDQVAERGAGMPIAVAYGPLPQPVGQEQTCHPLTLQRSPQCIDVHSRPP